MLPSARSPFPSASGGPLGFGCVGEWCIFGRRCRLCHSISRFSFPGVVAEAEVAMAPWNKSLLPRLRFVCAHSGAVEGCVRAELSGAGGPAMAWFLSVLEYSVVGVYSSSADCPGMWQALIARCSRPAVGFMDVRVVGLCVFLAGFPRRAQAQCQMGSGCVPGRCIFNVHLYCGSFESLWAMEFLLILESVLLSFFTGAFSPEEEDEQCRTVVARGSEGPWDRCVIFLFFGVLFAKFGGQLCPLCRFRRFSCLFGVVYLAFV